MSVFTRYGRQFDPRLEERQVAATLGFNQEPVYCRFVRQGIASGREQARADPYKRLTVRWRQRGFVPQDQWVDLLGGQCRDGCWLGDRRSSTL